RRRSDPAIGNYFDAMAIQCQIQQHTCVCRSILDAELSEYFEGTRVTVGLVSRRHGFDGQHQLAGMRLFTRSDTFGDLLEHRRREMPTTQIHSLDAAPACQLSPSATTHLHNSLINTACRN